MESHQISYNNKEKVPDIEGRDVLKPKIGNLALVGWVDGRPIFKEEGV